MRLLNCGVRSARSTHVCAAALCSCQLHLTKQLVCAQTIARRDGIIAARGCSIAACCPLEGTIVSGSLHNQQTAFEIHSC